MKKISATLVAHVVFLGIFFGVTVSFLLEYVAQFSSLNGLLLSNGEPFGGDFVAFYTGGVLFRTAPESLYDLSAQLTFQREFASAYGQSLPFLPFVYPPPIALLFAPLSLLPFSTAYFVWVAFSLFLVGVTLFLLSDVLRLTPFERIFAYAGAMSFLPFAVFNLAGGQLAALGIFVIGVTYYLIRKEKGVLAGIVLGIGAYKPPLFLILVVILASQKQYRLLMGVAVAFAVQGVLSLLFLDTADLELYYSMVTRYLSGGVELINHSLPAKLGVGIFSFLTENLERGLAVSLYLFVSIAAFFTVLSMQRSRGVEPGWSFFYAAVACLSISLSLQVNRYDMALLLPVMVIVWKQASYLLKGNTAYLLFFTTALPHLLWDLYEKFVIFGMKFYPIQLFLPCYAVILLAVRSEKREGSDRVPKKA